MTDQIEKLTINRNTTGIHVKYSLTKDGISVNYTVKTYNAGLAGAIAEAKQEAKKLHLKAANALIFGRTDEELAS